MSRSLLRLAALLPVFISLQAGATPRETASPSRPNVLLVVIDDLNDYVSVLEKFPGVKTPNLDKFARTATTFSRAYCAAPICNPSRTATLSGVAPYRNGVYDNDDQLSRSQPVLDSVLLPEQFHRNGYFTMWNGKIFHTQPPKSRLAAMWDDAEGGQGIYGPRPAHDPIPASVKKPPMFSYAAWTGPDTDFCDVTNLRINLRRLGRTYDKPFFLAYGIYRPHNPWTAPKRYFDLHPLDSITLPDVPPGDLDDLPPIAVEYAHHGPSLDALKKVDQWKPVVQAYLASISFMDDNLGHLLDALDHSPYRDNTIVCLVADNGFHLGEKEHFAKYALWEQTTHILCMWRVLGLTKPGSVCDTPVSLIDLYPTFNELCRLSAVPQHLDGISLVPQLENPSTTRDRPALTTYHQNDHAVRDARWRYIRYHDGSEELYDHDNDPHEFTNLASRPELASVKERLARWFPAENVAPVGAGKHKKSEEGE